MGSLNFEKLAVFLRGDCSTTELTDTLLNVPQGTTNRTATLFSALRRQAVRGHSFALSQRNVLALGRVVRNEHHRQKENKSTKNKNNNIRVHTSLRRSHISFLPQDLRGRSARQYSRRYRRSAREGISPPPRVRSAYPSYGAVPSCKRAPTVSGGDSARIGSPAGRHASVRILEPCGRG